MSASDSVHASLESIGFAQLVLLFVTLIAYGVALGEAFPTRVRGAAAAAALAAALGFSAAMPTLADGVVLLGLAVVLVALFSGAAWLLTGLLGLNPPGNARIELVATAASTIASRAIDAALSADPSI